MSFLKKLFGGGGTAHSDPDPETHNGYRIYCEPVKDAGGYRIAARIEKDFGEDTKTHRMIRADTCNSLEEAAETSLLKAKMLIDQQGDAIF